MKPYLWIVYDHTSTSDCLRMLDTILKRHSNRDIIHEIGASTLRQATLERVPIVSEFRDRLDDEQKLVADFKGYPVFNRAGYDASLKNLVTVMATSPNETVQDVIQTTNTDQELVVFDLMNCLDDDWNVKRAQELARLGASLVRCHTQPSQQATRKSPTALIEKVCQRLKNSSTQVIAMGDLKPNTFKNLKLYIAQDQIFAIALSTAMMQSTDPNGTIAQFIAEINELVPDQAANEPDELQLPFEVQWAVIDELIRSL